MPLEHHKTKELIISQIRRLYLLSDSLKKKIGELNKNNLSKKTPLCFHLTKSKVLLKRQLIPLVYFNTNKLNSL
jgi:hypothetical protein